MDYDSDSTRGRRDAAVARLVTVALVWLILAPCALGQSLSPQAIEVANERGKKLFKEKKYREAVNIWRETFLRVDGEAELKLAKNLAIGYRKLKELDKVFYFYSFRYQRMPEAKRTEKMQKSLEVVAGALSTGKALVAVTTDVEGASIYMGGVRDENRYKFPFAWYFGPGLHTVTVTAEGMIPEERTFEVTAGEELAFFIALKPTQSVAIIAPVGPKDDKTATPGVVTPGPTVTAGPETDYVNEYGPWVTVGIGVIAAAVGGYCEVSAFAKEAEIKDEYEGKHKDDFAAKLQEGLLETEDSKEELRKHWDKQRKADFDDEVVPLNTAGVALLVVGGAATVGGLAWWYFTQDSSSSKSAYQLSPVVTPDGTAGMMLEFGF